MGLGADLEYMSSSSGSEMKKLFLNKLGDSKPVYPFIEEF
jgi:hypothetical protein